MDDWVSINVIDGSHDAVLEFLFGSHADVAQNGAGELERKPSIKLSQEPCLGVKVNWKRPSGLGGEPSFRLPGDVRRMIIEDQLDRRIRRIGGVEELLGKILARETLSRGRSAGSGPACRSSSSSSARRPSRQ